jgi:hypothetical protein
VKTITSDRADQVAEHLEVGAAHADRVAAAAEHEQRGHVGAESDDGHDEHGGAEDVGVGGVDQPVCPLHRHEHRDDAEQHAVDQRTENLRALVAEGLPVGRRTGGDEDRHERHHEAQQVGEHVPGVGEQRERSGDERAHDLDHEEHRDDHDGDDQANAVGHARAVVMPRMIRHGSSVGGPQGRG